MKIEAPGYNMPKKIIELIDNLKELDDARREGISSVDLQKATFVTPFATLALVVFADNNSIELKNYENSSSVANYLKAICFPRGTRGIKRTTKKYLPISRLPSTEENSGLSEYEDGILSMLSTSDRLASFKQNLKFFTHELVSNVNEHSRAKEYWIQAQYYGSQFKTCEIVIADCGIGYKESYKGTEYEVDSDVDAIINALEGKSSKSSLERGRGIPSIARLFVNGYGGRLVIMSGDHIVYYKPNKEKEIIPLKSYWDGSLICISFSLKDVSLYPYINF